MADQRHRVPEAYEATIKDLEVRLAEAVLLIEHAYRRGFMAGRTPQNAGIGPSGIWPTEEGLHEKIAALRGGVVRRD